MRMTTIIIRNYMAKPGDNWLGMVGADGVAVNVAVGIGLGNRVIRVISVIHYRLRQDLNR